MVFNQKERETFIPFYRYVIKHRNEVFTVEFSNGQVISALFDIAFEDDNELELNDPNYEEYTTMVFRNTSTQTLFSLNYHDLPNIEVYHKGKRIV